MSHWRRPRRARITRIFSTLFVPRQLRLGAVVEEAVDGAQERVPQERVLHLEPGPQVRQPKAGAGVVAVAGAKEARRTARLGTPNP